MPSSQKRKQDRAKKAGRLVLPHYPLAFSTNLTLTAHVDLLNSLRDDIPESDSIPYIRQTLDVYAAVIPVFVDCLCAAAEQERILEHEPATGDKGEALGYVTAQLKTSIDHAHRIAGLVFVEAATARLHLAYSAHGDASALEKVPDGVAMLAFFEDTMRAYEGLREALATHVALCESMGEAYVSGELEDGQLLDVAGALDEVWRSRTVQLVHRTVKELFEEFAKKFFEDGQAHVEAVRVLDEYEKGFEGAWRWVEKSGEMVRRALEVAEVELKEDVGEEDVAYESDEEDGGIDTAYEGDEEDGGIADGEESTGDERDFENGETLGDERNAGGETELGEEEDALRGAVRR
ncbi:hypothetical protein P171DRAFT_509140 [Karstenula rhodostoma CBS 690.94]|uniref:Uncharacterized protein n=1 Tax=Karstenula rhodostoma CBS 690.94 TaxID=1392251 RepID=A0A9P4UFR7_9PLEO|nr:hypothetical protein P171DRAFT_509140 [Karstenula rhodostoma CBS 690.94]